MDRCNHINRYRVSRTICDFLHTAAGGGELPTRCDAAAADENTHVLKFLDVLPVDLHQLRSSASQLGPKNLSQSVRLCQSICLRYSAKMKVKVGRCTDASRLRAWQPAFLLLGRQCLWSSLPLFSTRGVGQYIKVWICESRLPGGNRLLDTP